MTWPYCAVAHKQVAAHRTSVSFAFCSTDGGLQPVPPETVDAQIFRFTNPLSGIGLVHHVETCRSLRAGRSCECRRRASYLQ
jgi:hypothetical protein